MSTVTPPDNTEAARAWDGPLFDRFTQFREIILTSLEPHGEAAIAMLDPQPGQRVLDIGCGFGDTTAQLAARVAPGGEAVGVDVSSRFVEVARSEVHAPNARFLVADVQATQFDGPFDLAFSRLGTMFFASPVAALRNVRAAMAPRGRLAMVVWRRKIANDWIYRSQTIVEQFVKRPDEYDEPTCGPGPFSMADADTTSDILAYAGFTDIAFHRSDIPLLIGRDVTEAVAYVMALGPAGEILRLAGDRAAHLHADIDAALREGLGEYAEDDGRVIAPASTWIVTAVSPGTRFVR
jgi:SAM-dependent methyltransferase